MRAMMILLAVCLLAGMANLLPFEGSQISQLSPVEILCLYRQEDGVLAVCDGGIAAKGETVLQAVENLHTSAPGRLFLDTVDHVVCAGLDPEAETLLEAGLRPAVSIYTADHPPEDLKILAKYLQVHGGGVTLGRLEEQPHAPVPRLQTGVSGLYLES